MLIVMLLLSSGCATTRYYLHSASGQLDINNRSESIDTLLADQQLDTTLRERLERVQEIHRFAIDRLKLPDSGSYTRYADLGRDYVLWNLFAAPEFSTSLKRWCYPVAGCASYRGYFDREMLNDYAGKLKGQDYDIYIRGVPAYSTLGWFDDPVLNTVLDWPEPELAGLIFHELAHQQLYIEDDTPFNESFASAVQQAGIERWLQAQGKAQTIIRYRERLAVRQEVITLIGKTRKSLSALYVQELSDSEMREQKRLIMANAREQYQQLRSERKANPGFDKWFAGELNNAKLGSVASYHTYVDAFIAMLDSSAGDFDRFYALVKNVGALPEQQRSECLTAWGNADSHALDNPVCQINR